MQNKWTDDRLNWLKDECLPSCKTLYEAANLYHDKYGETTSERALGRAILKRFKVSAVSLLNSRQPQSIGQEIGQPALLRKRIAELEKELKSRREASEVAALVKSLILGPLAAPINPPTWLAVPGHGRMFHGVPTLFMSDIHHGEVVTAAEVNGCNAFDIRISRNRVKRTFERATYLLHSVFQNPEYPGIVLALGGDMVSGNIHEEIRETNEVTIFQAVIDLVEILSAGINLLVEEFGRVYVPCVVGNHGRLDRKPRAKKGPADNYEYILYHMLRREFAKDERVTIHVSDSFNIRYEIYGTRYLLTHGDQFRGGSGIAGNVTPWSLGDYRLRKQMQSMSSWTQSPSEYDVMLFGHFHSYFPGRGFLVNGSVKGFDEYAMKMGFAFEPPQQALWLTNPEYGMTFNCPVFCEDPPKKNEDAPWLTTQK